MPEISVIAPVYGVEQYIHQFMDSVLSQTYTDFEFIVVDDGSKDNCPAILDEYARRDSRVNVIHQPNGGVAVARNTGIKAATGKYVYIVDSDDWLEPTALEVLHRDAEKTGADCIMGDCMLQVDGKQYRRKQFSQKFYTDDPKEIAAIQQYVLCHKYSPHYSPLCINGYAAPWGKLIKMSVIKAHNITFDPSVKGLFDDGIFSMTVYNYIHSFYYGMECVYNYRINENSITQKFKPNEMDILKNSLNGIEQFISKYHQEERLITPYYYHVVRSLIGKLWSYFFNNKNTNSKEQVRKELLETIKSQPFNKAIKKCKVIKFDTKKEMLATVFLKMHTIIGLRFYIWLTRIQAKIRGI